MSIILRVSIPTQGHIGAKTIEIESSGCTMAEIKEKIADKFQVGIEEITKLEIEINSVKKKDVGHLKDVTLQDFNMESGSYKVTIQVQKNWKLKKNIIEKEFLFSMNYVR